MCLFAVTQRAHGSLQDYTNIVLQEEVAGFKDAAAVLARARAMAAQQLAVEPAVRAFVRKAVADITTVTTGVLWTLPMHLPSLQQQRLQPACLHQRRSCHLCMWQLVVAPQGPTYAAGIESTLLHCSQS